MSSPKRAFIHIGIMTVCLMVLLIAILAPAAREEAPSSAPEAVPVTYALTHATLEQGESEVTFCRLLAQTETTDGCFPLVLYYQYTLRSMGEAKYELDVRVESTPRPGFIPLVCREQGAFSLEIPIYRLQSVDVVFCGKTIGGLNK